MCHPLRSPRLRHQYNRPSISPTVSTCGRGIRPRRTTCGIASPHLVRHRAVALVARANRRQRGAVHDCDALLYQFIPGSSGHQRPPQRAIYPYRWLGRMELGIQRNPMCLRRQRDHGRRSVGISAAACSITRDNTITVVRIQLFEKLAGPWRRGLASPSAPWTAGYKAQGTRTAWPQPAHRRVTATRLRCGV